MSETRNRASNVKQVRGPFVRLASHPDVCTNEPELMDLAVKLRTRDPSTLLAADLFAGAGGLSLGLHQAGIQTILSVDHDTEAVETHRHHFPGLSVDWDLGKTEVVERVANLMLATGIDVLAGGPPCQPFSKAGRSKIRDRVRKGLRDPHDQRRDLWRSYLEVIQLAQPRAVIMENVPDMALDREMFILRSIGLELELLGYSVKRRVIETRVYGVPQFRQRLILVALKGGLQFTWPEQDEHRVNVRDAISDLPPIEGGWRPEGGAAGWKRYPGPNSQFQTAMRVGVPPEEQDRVYDHITRPVREDDKRAFELMDPETKYSDLDEELRRYRKDIFDDKYKRLDNDGFSRTITAHIAKDGYWYIHPTQHRTITVREAARLQTFPDWYRFAGPPSSAFRQIGNAVPPRIGQVIGTSVKVALANSAPGEATAEVVSQQLAGWFREQEDLIRPWFRAETRWQALCGEILLDRATPQQGRSIWPLLARRRTAAQTLANADELLMLGDWTRRRPKAEEILRVASILQEREAIDLDDDTLAGLVADKILSATQADTVALMAPATETTSEEPVIINKGVLRVAANFTGEAVNARNRLTDGRLTVARMIGYGPDARHAHLALMELSAEVCRSNNPDCEVCPLSKWCAFAAGRTATIDLREKAGETAPSTTP